MSASEGARPLLAAVGITKLIREKKILDDVSIGVASGRVLGLIGASGSGKSTLLRCLNLLERPDAGRIILDGEPVGGRLVGDRWIHDPERSLLKYRAKVGMIFQSYNLFPHLSVIENIIEAPMAVRRQSKSEATEKAMQLLAEVRLSDKARSYPRELSGGQQQRVAIARALAMEPRALLLDEVTSALDPQLVAEVLATIQRLAEKGVTMVVVSHEMTFIRAVASHVAFMDAGRVVEEGTSDMMDNPTNEATELFLRRFRNER